ncbi:hypothetical protein ACFU8R_16250 [Pseudonocardia alni]|uniref:hypothetical protein n=1 Tax=Pseudonocardia alni TaxID=33907 RepID=UPI0036CD210B
MTESDGQTWGTVDLSGDPHIVLGKRQGRGIAAVRVDVHQDLFNKIRPVCSKAILDTQTTKSRGFDPNAALEAGEEHFRLTVADIRRLNQGLTTNSSSESSPQIGEPIGRPEDDEEFAIVKALRNPIEHRPIKKSEFLEYQPFFYAICFQQKDDSWVSFLRKTNPQQFFRLGRVWCQYGNALKQTDEQPTFALDPSIDVVLYGDNLAGFSASAIKFLFTDARLARAAVPDKVEQLREAIAGTLPLSSKGAASLVAAGARRNSFASRIYGLRARLEEVQEHGPVDAERFRILAGEDQAVLDLLNNEDQLEFEEHQAEIFLDFIEGRYFADDWTGNDRRADRWSKR